jgi:uncharacterized protein DUF4326
MSASATSGATSAIPITGSELLRMRGGTRPLRLRLSRRRGFSLQVASRTANGLTAVVVARPSRWGNPFRVGNPHPGDSRAPLALAESVRLFRRQWQAMPKPLRDAVLAPLRGKNLACWCPLDGPCHADVLLAMAND